MLFAAWSGPIPLVHRHAFSRDSVEVNVEAIPHWYLEHLRSCHREANVTCDSECQWHAHLLIPGVPDAPSGVPTQCRLDRVPISVGASQILEHLQDYWIGLVFAYAQVNEVKNAPQVSTQPAHFIEPTQPRLILTTQFCVVLC